jgi:predicted MFS family arabinose efflux permease
MGISIVTLGWLNSLRNLTGLTTPVAGVLADRIGYRAVMRGALWVGGLGLLLFGASQSLWMGAVGMIVMGLGLFAFVPVFQAYLSARIPYANRARALGIVEYSWALAGILGLSLSGVLISRFGWRAPFLLLGSGLILVAFLFGALPATTVPHLPRSAAEPLLQWRRWPQALASFVRFDSYERSAWGAILVSALNVYATGHVGIMYGTWLTREYGLNAVQLGTAALLLGLVDLVASVLVSVFTDRIGKRRSVLLSTGASVFAYALLPFLNTGLIPAMLSLVVTRFTFEVSMVSNISLLSEQVPKERGKVLALASAAVTTAAAISSIAGPVAYSRWGVWGLGTGAALATLIAWLLLVRNVRERHELPAGGKQT